MRCLFTQNQPRITAKRLSSLAVGGAITLSVSISSTIVYAQSDVYAQPEPSMTEGTETEGTETEGSAVEQVSGESSSSASFPAASVSEKVARLEAAIATLDSYYSGEYAESNRVLALLRFSLSYSELGEQLRAVALLEQAVEIGLKKEDAERWLLGIVPTYVEIGETEMAEALLAQTLPLSDMREIHLLIDIAEAYHVAEEPELAASTLSVATDLLSEPSDWASSDDASSSGDAFRNLGLIAEAYGQLAEDEEASSVVSSAIEAGVSRLVALTEAGIATDGIENNSSALATTQSQLAIAQAKRGDASAAETLAAQAMEIVREGDEIGGVMAAVARAYGYVANGAVAEQALAELMQLTLRDLSMGKSIKSDWALGEIAIAYEQIGNQAQSNQSLLALSENFDDLYGLVHL